VSRGQRQGRSRKSTSSSASRAGRGERIVQIAHEGVRTGCAREPLAVLVRLLERLQRLVVVVDLAVRPAQRVVARHAREHGRDAGHREGGVQRHEPRLEHRRVDHGQAREPPRVLQRRLQTMPA